MTDSSPLPIAINGVLGRMGRRVAALAQAAGCRIVAAVDRPDSDASGQTLAALGVLSADSPGADVVVERQIHAGAGAAVCIDFSLPPAVPSRLAECADAGIAFVTGTTGGDAEMQAALDAAAGKVAVLQAPNFSVGVALMVELTKRAVEVLGPEFACEIVELHHRRKVDSPSGTANALARAAADGAKVDLARVGNYGRKGHTGERPPQEIGVHAVRGGDVIGEHTVHLLGPEERVELTHKAASRDIFVRGALRAARWIAGKAPGHYTMRDVLGAL